MQKLIFDIKAHQNFVKTNYNGDVSAYVAANKAPGLPREI
jgi:hypothetical protein